MASVPCHSAKNTAQAETIVLTQDTLLGELHSNILSRGSAIQVNVDAPPANFRCCSNRAQSAGTVAQMRWALTVEGVSMQTRWRSRASRVRMHARTAQWTKQITEYSHGDRPQMAIADVHHICHIGQVKCTRIIIIQHLRVPSSQFRSEAENA